MKFLFRKVVLVVAVVLVEVVRSVEVTIKREKVANIAKKFICNISNLL